MWLQTATTNPLWQAVAVAMRSPDTERLSGDDRRESLLDVTKAIVQETGPAGVNMGTVAERAEVTRALVYKHFENKEALLIELYRREARRLDKQLRIRVEAAPDGFEPKLRAFAGAVLDAVDEHAPFFAPLRGAGRNRTARQDQRGWDRRTVGYFAGLAADEFSIDEETARAVIAVLLAGIQSLLSQMRSRPGAGQRAFLEDLYVDTAVGALTHIAATGRQPDAGSGE